MDRAVGGRVNRPITRQFSPACPQIAETGVHVTAAAEASAPVSGGALLGVSLIGAWVR